MRIPRLLTVAAVAVLFLASPAPAQQPTLVVVVTVDQLRPDYISTWESQLTGGLARFWRDGTFFTNAFQDHANTETAPGHASILSGRFPYSTGILSNARGANTPESPLIDAPDTGASPARFRGTTLADWMQAKDPRARVLSVSRKDRTAILPVAPSHAHTALWYSPKTGRFTTSTWYATTLPGWVQAFNAERNVQRLAGRAWNLMLPESAYPEPDSVAGEARNNVVFPHVLSTDTVRAASTIQDFPWMDSLILNLAWRGVRAMDLGGTADRVDLLSVSLSTTDAVGHKWGPDSRELHDQVLHADRYLGAFLDSLYALRGRDRVIVALTADHGVAPSPEIHSRFGDNSGAMRVPTAEFRPAIAAARAQLRLAGVDTTAFRWEERVLWFDRNKPGCRNIDVGPIAQAFAQATRLLPGVLRADVITELAHADTTADFIARRWIRMYVPGVESYPGESALVAVTLNPFLYLGQGDVASHGTPFDYDAHVPLAFLGRQFVTGHQNIKVNVVDLAPTLAAVLGIRPLERLDGRILKEAIR
jgi:predicted AlkP superfamily pyrophosphatase or phosphodiesterase